MNRRFPDNVKPCADCGEAFPWPTDWTRKKWLHAEACLSCEPERLRQRIRAGVVIDSNGCWIWQRSIRTGTGYGQITVHDVPSAAHVVAYRVFVAPVPPGLCVCHRCDVRTCCNPEHLFVGTAKDNHDDMWAKGRGAKPPRIVGEAHHKATLTDEQVAEVKRLRSQGISQRALARRFGVSQSTVWRFVHEVTRSADG